MYGPSRMILNARSKLLCKCKATIHTHCSHCNKELPQFTDVCRFTKESYRGRVYCPDCAKLLEDSPSTSIARPRGVLALFSGR